MKRFRMPTAYTILFFLLIAVAAATWFVPAGQYAREGEDQTPVAGTYAQVEQQPQGPAEVVLAPFRGRKVSACPTARVMAAARRKSGPSPVREAKPMAAEGSISTASTRNISPRI